MTKRLMALMLVLLLALPLPALGTQTDDLQLTVSPHSVKFVYTNAEYRFVQVTYSTTYDSGTMTLYNAQGVFEGECDLPATFAGERMTLTVETLAGERLLRKSTATAEAPYGSTDENQPQVAKKVSTLQNLSISYEADGLHYSFDAPGHTLMHLRCRSPQELHEIPIYAGANYHYEGVLPMRYTYNDSYLYMRICTSNRNITLYETSDVYTYLEMPAAPAQAQTGRLNGVTVCIDPGHQRKTQIETVYRAPNSTQTVTTTYGMASGTQTGRLESIVTLEVGILLRDMLLAEGATVIMTRETQETFVGMLERADIPNNAGADFVLRLHCNSGTAGRQGIQVYCPSTSSYAQAVADTETYSAMAETILNAMKAATGQTRGNYTLNGNYVGNNWSKMPSFLIEMGYMSDAEEDRLLSSPVYQCFLAEGMVEGVVKLSQMRGLID